MLTWRFAVHLNRSLVGLLGIVIEKTDVAYLRSFPCVVVKKIFQVTCGDPETEVDLILSRAGIFETPKDIDDFKICWVESWFHKKKVCLLVERRGSRVTFRG